MKITILILACAFALFTVDNFPQGAEVGTPESSAETLRAEIVRVYSADMDGHRFRGYVVEWEGNEVIVTDTLGDTDFDQGDTVRFIAQKIRIRDQDVAVLVFHTNAHLNP